MTSPRFSRDIPRRGDATVPARPRPSSGRLAAGRFRFLVLLAALAAPAVAMSAPLELTVARAWVKADAATGEPVLDLTLSPESAAAFGELTAANLGKVVELRIDGEVVFAPMVRDAIRGGLVEISGQFSRLELLEDANRIWSGTARVEVEPRRD